MWDLNINETLKGNLPKEILKGAYDLENMLKHYASFSGVELTEFDISEFRIQYVRISYSVRFGKKLRSSQATIKKAALDISSRTERSKKRFILKSVMMSFEGLIAAVTDIKEKK